MDKKELKEFVKLVKKKKDNRYDCELNPTLEELDYLNSKGVYCHPHVLFKSKRHWMGREWVHIFYPNIFFCE